MSAQNRSKIRKLIPGFVATFLGIGFSRFSFTPMSALMVEKQILSSHDITIITAFMMAGYAIGAFSANALSEKFGAVAVVRSSFVIVSLGLLVEGLFAGFLPVLTVRFIMPVCGALLMVLGPGMILSTIPPEQRGFAAGFIFTGIGAGVMLSGALVALIAASPIAVVGLALFCAAAAFSLIGWKGWPDHPVKEVAGSKLILNYGFLGLLAAYSLDAIAYIPHTVFLSDFVSSELGHGAQAGGFYWVVFGIGGIIGAAGAVTLRRIFGPQLSLEIALATKAIFIGLLGYATSVLTIGFSALIVGALVPGFVMLIATRTSDLVGAANFTKAWGLMTGVFAIGQFVGATGMSFAYLSLGKYQPLFAIGGLFEALGLLIVIISIRVLTPQVKGTKI